MEVNFSYVLRVPKVPVQDGAPASPGHVGYRLAHLSTPPLSAYGFCPLSQMVLSPLGFVLQVLEEKKQ